MYIWYIFKYLYLLIYILYISGIYICTASKNVSDVLPYTQLDDPTKICHKRVEWPHTSNAKVPKVVLHLSRPPAAFWRPRRPYCWSFRIDSWSCWCFSNPANPLFFCSYSGFTTPSGGLCSIKHSLWLSCPTLFLLIFVFVTCFFLHSCSMCNLPSSTLIKSFSINEKLQVLPKNKQTCPPNKFNNFQIHSTTSTIIVIIIIIIIIFFQSQYHFIHLTP